LEENDTGRRQTSKKKGKTREITQILRRKGGKRAIGPGRDRDMKEYNLKKRVKRRGDEPQRGSDPLQFPKTRIRSSSREESEKGY